MKYYLKYLFIFLILLIPINTFAADYQVATDGSGDYTTIAQVNAASFNAGDNIYFRRGDTWAEGLVVPSSGSVGNPITFGSYGTGNRPIITYTSGDCMTVRNVSYIDIENLHFTGGQDRGLQINIGSSEERTTNINVTNCLSNWNGRDGFKAAQDVETGATKTTTDITYRNCIAHDNGEHGFQASDGSKNIYVYDCTAYSNGKSGYEANGFRMGETVNGEWFDCISYSNTEAGFGIEYSEEVPENITMKRCISYLNQQGFKIKGVVGTDISYSIFYSNTDAGILFVNDAGAPVDIDNGNFYNNTFYNNNTDNTATRFNITLLDDFTNSFFKNNIFYNTVITTGNVYVSSDTTNVTFDYNCYYVTPSQTIINWQGAEYTNFATYQAAIGEDANSIAEDPLFNELGKSIQAISPCINAGVDVSLTEDFWGAPIVGLPDIGAHEYFNTLIKNASIKNAVIK